MNYIKELNKMYHWCMSKKRSKSEIALLHALYMINNAEDWTVWFEADNEYIQRLTGGLTRESINEARNKLKQAGRIDFKEGTRNIQSAKYMIIPFEVDIQVDKVVDMKVDKVVDMKVDKVVDEQVDPISKQNKTKQDISLDGGNAAERKANPNEVVVNADAMFEKAYENYPRKEGKADGKRLYLTYLTNGRDIKGIGRIKLNHGQLSVAIQAYALEVAEREKDMVKHFDTFMNKSVIDYAEKTKEEYESAMQKKYGEGWEKLKFEYTFKGQKKTTVKEGEAV